MSYKLEPASVWLRYGLSDLFFGSSNQANDVYRYGTFFYIMAAEKHLKAVILFLERESYDSLGSFDKAKSKADSIAKSYGHNFKDMITKIEPSFSSVIGDDFLPKDYYGFDTSDFIEAMNISYMETRYPTIRKSSNLFPFENSKDSFHCPIGSSWFTESIEDICTKCWRLLSASGLDVDPIIDSISEQFIDNSHFEVFKRNYLSKVTPYKTIRSLPTD